MIGSCYAFACMSRPSRRTRPDSAQALRERLACLADPSRFRIIQTLAGGERFVSDLAQAIGLSQSCTTRHLQALARHGLVAGRRRGRRVMFSIRDLPETRIALEASAAAPRRPPAVHPLPGRRRGAAQQVPARRARLAPVFLMEHEEAADARPGAGSARTPVPAPADVPERSAVGPGRADRDPPDPSADGGRSPDRDRPDQSQAGGRPATRFAELEDYLL